MSAFRKVIRPGTILEGRRHASVFCEVELSETGRLSIGGVVGPLPSGNALGSCGQIDMGFAHRLSADDDSRYSAPILASEFTFAAGWDAELWLDFLDVWKRWHLNDMRPSADGSAWEREEVPAEVLDFLQALPDADRAPAWV